MSKKNTFYFSHDYNAKNDNKLTNVLQDLGWSGYGLFWGIVEELYINDNSIEYDLNRLSYRFRTDSNTLKALIEQYDLFEIEQGFFYSKSIQKRLNERESKSISARESVNSRWKKKNELPTEYERNTNVVRTDLNSNTIKERKGKERKVNNSTCSKIEFSNGNSFSLDQCFEMFWENYNKKQGRSQCEKKFNKLDPKIIELVILKAKEYESTISDKQYQKLPLTWLNGKNWEDELKQDISKIEKPVSETFKLVV